MNGFGKHGSTLGNSAGVLALMFTSFESLCESAELDKLCGDNDFARRPRPPPFLFFLEGRARDESNM